MVNALKIVDEETYFGTGAARERCFLNVEVNPPDGSVKRAELFHSKEKIKEWLDEGSK